LRSFMPQKRLLNRFSGYLSAMVLAVALAGIATAPTRIAAQETPAAGAAAPAKPEVTKSQEEQNEAFLTDGPVVKWMARTFNMAPKAASNIFLIVNFGIVVLLLGVPLVRVLPKILRKRGETVRTDLEAARKATEEANARLRAIEAKLAGLDGEIALIRAQVEEESKQDEARIKASMEDESARILAAAEQELNVAAAQARRSLRNFAADLAIEQAAKQLTFTPETDRALIAEFLGEVELSAGNGNGAIKGGQN